MHGTWAGRVREGQVRLQGGILRRLSPIFYQHLYPRTADFQSYGCSDLPSHGLADGASYLHADAQADGIAHQLSHHISDGASYVHADCVSYDHAHGATYTSADAKTDTIAYQCSNIIADSVAHTVANAASNAVANSRAHALAHAFAHALAYRTTQGDVSCWPGDRMALLLDAVCLSYSRPGDVRARTVRM